MDKNKLERIKRFINDKATADAVYSALLQAFLKPIAANDVGLLAASRLSIDNLGEAWKTLDNLKDFNENEVKDKTQIGL